jgi:HAD superfamily hydrolase (TIGR01509 family)
MRTHLRLFPGVDEFIRRAADKYPLVIASGALRREIELVLDFGGLRDYFLAIVSAEDVARGKPDPESFLKAHGIINAHAALQISAQECLVIEDSLHGVEAARLAGMPVLAVTNSYSKEQLSKADFVVESLDDLSLDSLQAL